jgi:hypothetical protein
MPIKPTMHARGNIQEPCSLLVVVALALLLQQSASATPAFSASAL